MPLKSNHVPALGDLLERIKQITVLSSETLSSSSSILPPVSFLPNKRAGITLVSFKTSKSPASI
jgi:hypothetical protein